MAQYWMTLKWRMGSSVRLASVLFLLFSPDPLVGREVAVLSLKGGEEPTERLVRAFSERVDHEAIWGFYLTHKDALLSEPLSRQETSVVNKVIAARHLTMVASALGKPEIRALFDWYQRSMDKFQALDGGMITNESPELVRTLCESGHLAMASEAVTNSRRRHELRAKAARARAELLPPGFRELALLQGEMPDLPEKWFMEAIGDWSEVERHTEIFKRMVFVTRKAIPAFANQILFSDEMIMSLEAEVKYRSGKIGEAKRVANEFLEREANLLKLQAKDLALGGREGSPDNLFVDLAQYRVRITLAAIELEDGQVARAAKLLDEAEPQWNSAQRFLSKTSDAKKAGHRISLGRLDLADLQVRVAIAQNRGEDAVKAARALVELCEGDTAESPQLLFALQLHAWSLIRSNCGEEAGLTVSRICNIQLNLAKNLFEGGSERQKLVYLQHADPFSLPAAMGDARQMANLVVPLKGAVLDSVLSSRRELGRAGPADRDLLKQLNEANRALTNVTLGGEGNLEKRRTDVEVLQAKLSKKAVVSPESTFSCTPEKVRNALNPGEALCDFVRYRTCNETGNWVPCYGVLVLRPDQPAAWVPLGPAEAIDLQIGNLIAAHSGGIPSEPRVRETLSRIHGSIVAPLMVAIKDCKRLIISPDSATTQVPFAVLLDSDGVFLSSSHEIVYVSSARDLLAEVKSDWKGSAVIVAAPDFEVPPAAEFRKADRVELVSTLPFDPAAAPDANPLPGAREEMVAVSGTLERLGCEVRTLTGADATQSRLSLELETTPSILHFATHGFVLPASRRTLSGLSSSGTVTDILPASRPAADELQLARRGSPVPSVNVDGIPPLLVDQPLERAMLALSSAQKTFNGWKRQELVDTEHDGILTAAEASRFDLSGTHLVVLSACDTGVGDPVAGQGVMGLRRGFLTAGANHLLITFWKEDAEWAPKIMDEFYEELGRTGHPAVALSILQRKCLASPERFGGFSNMVFVVGALGASATGKLPVIKF